MTGKNGDDAFQKQLTKGGQRIRITGRANLYERRGTQLEQINDYGSPVKTRPILSNRIRIADHLRGIGNLYGAYVEQLTIGGSGEFLADKVDGGQHGTGGTSPHLVAISQEVKIAQSALRELPLIRHRRKSEISAGPHRALSHRELIDAVCVEGKDIAEVALIFGWYVQKPTQSITIPKQQSQKLKTALIEGLKAIDTAWGGSNTDVTLFEGLEIG